MSGGELQGQTDTHSNPTFATDSLGDPGQVTTQCSDAVSSSPQRENIYKMSACSRCLLNVCPSPPCFPLNQCKHNHLGLGTLQIFFLPLQVHPPIYLNPSIGTTSSKKPPQAALIDAELLLTCKLCCTPGVGGWWVWAHVPTASLVSHGLGRGACSVCVCLKQ